MKKTLEIKKGDKIRVSNRYTSVVGIVDTANNWGDSERSDWYIEFHDLSGGACYVKEQYDKATIEKIGE